MTQKEIKELIRIEMHDAILEALDTQEGKTNFGLVSEER